MATRRIFSGIQPTGIPHLGNYLGAIKNWVQLQAEDQVLYSIVDLHALTVPKSPVELRTSVRDTAAALIACGVDVQKSVLFQQSSVPQHSELAWILNCHCPLGWLRRMTQFKAKAKLESNANNLDVFSSTTLAGLFTYPTLMAADILLYRTTHVPVGDDQKQHVELTRELARTMNTQYDHQLFVEPETIIGQGYRIMSLRDGKVKMSKSDESDQSRINLDDSADAIALKIKRAKTDSFAYISFDPIARPEISNLLNIFGALSDQPAEKLIATRLFKDSSHLKTELTEVVVEKLKNIREEIGRLRREPGHLDDILQQGGRQAKEKAENNMKLIRQSLGLYSC